MANKKILSNRAKDLYNCFLRGIIVNGNKTEYIKELLNLKLISQEGKGKNMKFKLRENRSN